MNYCMEYLKTANVNLVKDMGMIPYKLYKKYGINSWVATYENGEYPYLDKEVKGLKIDFIKRIFHSYTLDGGIYVFNNAKSIDVLQIFHVTLSSVVYTYMYKLRNKKGKIYLKLDCSYKLPERIKSLNKLSRNFLKRFFGKIDIVSLEQELLYDELLKVAPYLNDKLIKIPNGLDYKYLEDIKLSYDYDAKENIILNVARIGAKEKRTEMLMEAFASVKNIENLPWKLHLIGPIEEDFYDYIEKFYNTYPKLKDKVIFKGNIEDRRELFEEYKKAKIFSLTSEFESFGFSFLEAAALGDVIVSTDVGIARELVSRGNGAVVPIDDKEGLTNSFEHYMNAGNLKEESLITRELSMEKFDWDKIIEQLYNELIELFRE